MGGHTQRPWTPTKRRGPIAAEYNSPGPACVTLPNLIGKTAGAIDSKRGRAPAFSFGGRHGGKSESLGPGPGQYNVTGLSAKGKDTPPSLSLHSRARDSRHDNTPAPGDYNPEKSEKIIHETSPKFTFGLKTNVGKPVDTPAPGDYSPEKAITALDSTPKYTFGFKTNVEKPFETPAPGDYKPEQFNLDHTPCYSFGQKTGHDKPLDTPAPNVYNIPSVLGGTKEGNKKAAPAFTISGRQKDPTDDRIRNPGPGSYNNCNPDVYNNKLHSPSYTISARYTLPSDDTLKPGPGVYSPEKVSIDLQPAHSFGIKHSVYSCTMRS